MVPKRKDERQYAGVSYDVANSTPDDELLDKYSLWDELQGMVEE